VNTLLKYLTRNPLVALLGLIIILGLAWAGSLKWELHKASQGLEEATTERDRLAIQATAARAEANGWEVSYGRDVQNLRKVVRARDSANAVLADDLHASRVRISYLAEVNVSLRGQVESFGSLTGQPDSGSEGLEPPQWAGELSDGLLTASWAFRAVDARLLLDPYSVEISGELIGTEGGDGSHVVFTRASDPRVTLSLGSYTFQAVPPVIRDRCSWTHQGIMAGIGFLGGVWTGARVGG